MNQQQLSSMGGITTPSVASTSFQQRASLLNQSRLAAAAAGTAGIPPAASPLDATGAARNVWQSTDAMFSAGVQQPPAALQQQSSTFAQTSFSQPRASSSSLLTSQPSQSIMSTIGSTPTVGTTTTATTAMPRTSNIMTNPASVTTAAAMPLSFPSTRTGNNGTFATPGSTIASASPIANPTTNGGASLLPRPSSASTLSRQSSSSTFAGSTMANNPSRSFVVDNTASVGPVWNPASVLSAPSTGSMVAAGNGVGGGNGGPILSNYPVTNNNTTGAQRFSSMSNPFAQQVVSSSSSFQGGGEVGTPLAGVRSSAGIGHGGFYDQSPSLPSSVSSAWGAQGLPQHANMSHGAQYAYGMAPQQGLASAGITNMNDDGSNSATEEEEEEFYDSDDYGEEDEGGEYSEQGSDYEQEEDDDGANGPY